LQSYTYNGKAVDYSNLYVIDSQLGVFTNASGSAVYTGTVYGKNNEVLTTVKKDGKYYSYWAAKVTNPDATMDTYRVADYQKDLNELSDNDLKLQRNDIKEVQMNKNTDGSATIQLMRNGADDKGVAVDGAITVSAGGGKNNKDTYITLSNGTNEVTLLTGTKVVANNTKTTNPTSLTGLTINGTDYKLDTGATYTAGTNIKINNNEISATDTTYTAGDGITITSDDSHKISVDPSKVNLSYKANDGTAKTVSLKDGLNFKNGTNTTADIGADGIVTFNLNSALTGMTSITMDTGTGGTSQVQLTKNGLSNGGYKITNVKAGEAGTDAVNVSQLTQAKDEVTASDQHVKKGRYAVTSNSVTIPIVKGTNDTATNDNVVLTGIASTGDITTINNTIDKGLNFAANSGTTVNNKLGSTVKVQGTGTKDDDKYSGNNIKTKVSQTNGQTTIDIMLDKDLTGLNSVTTNKVTLNDQSNSTSITYNSNDNSIRYGSSTSYKTIATTDQLWNLQVAGTDVTPANNKINLKAGDNVTIANDGNAITIGAISNGDAGAVHYAKKNDNTTDYTKVIMGDSHTTYANKLGGTKVTNVAYAGGTDGSEAVNVDYLKDSETKLKDSEQHIKATTYAPDKNGNVTMTYVDGNGNAVTGETAVIKDVAKASDLAKGLNFAANSGKAYTAQMGNTVTVKGGGTKLDDSYSDANIKTVINDSGVIDIMLDKDLTGLNSATMNQLILHNINGSTTVTYNGTDRIQYTSGGQTKTLATLDDGMKYMGDSGTLAKTKLNQTVNVVGGVTDSTKLTNGNIGTVSSQTTEGDTTVTVKLNKDLTNLNSITMGAAAGDTTVSLGTDGLHNGGNKITNVGAGLISSTSTDAVNGSQLAAVQKEAAAHSTVSAGNGNIVVKPNTDTKTGITNYAVSLNKDITLGDDTKGDATVTIKGSDGTITAGNGDNKVVADGKNGTLDVGKQISMDGKTGSGSFGNVKIDGKTGQITGLTNTTLDVEGFATSERAATEEQLQAAMDKSKKEAKDSDIHVAAKSYETTEQGTVTMDLVDGTGAVVKDNAGNPQQVTITNVASKTQQEANTEAIESGLNFAGDTGNAFKSSLGDTVNIKGDKNITTVASTGEIQVTLNQDLSGLRSVQSETFTSGNTTMTTDGLTITNGPSVTTSGIDAGGKKITNVANGDITPTSTDAVNGSQLYETNQLINQSTQNYNSLQGSINKLGNRMNRIGAGAAALAALHPLDFDPDAKWDFAAGYGNYRNANAVAVGAYYRPNEDLLVGIGGSMGGGENMVNAGVSIKLGSGSSHVTTSRVAMAKEIVGLKENVAQLTALVNQLVGSQNRVQSELSKEFPDVPANHWAYEAVNTMASQGIIEGYPDGTFGGDRSMTRYEFATLVYRALQKGVTMNADISRLVSEFKPELDLIRIDTIAKDKAGNPTIERVRVNKTK
jgi:hypothetical protein